MMNQSLKILFFGSGPVAAACLELLLDGGQFNIEAVVTKPKPAHHRGATPVIELCEHKNIAYTTTTNKADLTAFFESKPYTSTLGVVIDFGIIIEQPVIDYFALGIINSHFSLLPQWRGADPISFALLSGQPETAVSLMSINARMDEGPLLASQKLVIQPTDTSESLTHKLIHLSNQLLLHHLPIYATHAARSHLLHEQTGAPSYSRKLTKQDGLVDWTKPAAVIEREIRAYHQWPKSAAEVGRHRLIIREADVIETTGKPGKHVATKQELIVYCGHDALSLRIVQPVNKKEMPVQAFLSGYSL